MAKAAKPQQLGYSLSFFHTNLRCLSAGMLRGQREVKWDKPPDSCVKVNVDGSSIRNLRRPEYRGLIQDNMGI